MDYRRCRSRARTQRSVRRPPNPAVPKSGDPLRVLNPALIRHWPLRSPADLTRHTLLPSETLRNAWGRWFALAELPELKPARPLLFCHSGSFRRAGGGHGPIALVGQGVQGRLLMPFSEPALRARCYFVYVPKVRTDAPAIAALRQWLFGAGRLADANHPRHLSARRPIEPLR